MRRRKHDDGPKPTAPSQPQRPGTKQTGDLPDIKGTLTDLDAILNGAQPKTKPCPNCGTYTCPGAGRS